MNKPYVSIIVPIFNVPSIYLKKCIESTINQTLSEIEIILIDDGSNESNKSICDNYASNDHRIVVVHKKNEGVSASRNLGVEIASGKWILFLDGDDWIEPKTCKTTYEIAEKYNVDLLMFKTVQEFKTHSKPYKYIYDTDLLFEKDECKQLLHEILVFESHLSTAWAKVIKREFLIKNSIKHNEELKQGAEGIEFNIRLFQYIKRAYFLDMYLYHYIYKDLCISSEQDEMYRLYIIKCFTEIKNNIILFDDPILLKQYYVRFSYAIVATAISGLFNPCNNQTFKDKCIRFKEFLNNCLVVDTIKSVDRKMIEPKRRFILFLIEKKMFITISIIAKIRKIQKCPPPLNLRKIPLIKASKLDKNNQ